MLKQYNRNFNLNDEYFVDYWDGLFTVDNIAEWYCDNTDADEVLDNLISNWDDIAEDIKNADAELFDLCCLLSVIENNEELYFDDIQTYLDARNDARDY